MSENKVKKVAVNTTINGEEMDILVDPYISLLETLREVVGITGTKEGCNDGNCGACTINLDGRIVDSCLVLGVEAEGKNIETVEGMATPDGLHPLQQAFLEEAALQCGICTPGFLVSAKALLDNELGSYLFRKSLPSISQCFRDGLLVLFSFQDQTRLIGVGCE